MRAVWIAAAICVVFVAPVTSTSAGSESTLAKAAACIQLPARPQRVAPAFNAPAVLPSGEFANVQLSDYLGKYVVLFFYPMDFTFVCPTEIIAFSDRSAEFHAIDTEVLAMSVDSKYTHLAWRNTPREEGGLGALQIPLISDITKQISRDYGVLIDSGDDEGVSLRGLFIISDKGVIRSLTINDLPVGRSVDETLRLVNAFKYTDVHGEVCPAGWEPGAETMVDDPLKSKEYFRAINKK